MATKEIPFRPNLEGDFRNRFYIAASKIKKGTPLNFIENICNNEIDWVENHCIVNLDQRKRYRAVWYLFRDLVRASWVAEFKDGILLLHISELNSHDDDKSIRQTKELIRSWMQEGRHERIVASADFVSRVEDAHSTDKKSITELIADGAELSERLSKVRDGKINVTDAVKPYLQLVTEKGIDPFTKQRTADIWRYFRMTWATPAENTPGRTMQYLIRDAAQPMHAIMGLASLENSAVAINCRDRYIGWTPEALNLSIKNGTYTPLQVYQKLISYLNESIEGIDYSDLCTVEDICNPSAPIIDNLNNIANEAKNQRKNLIESSSTANQKIGEKDIARSDESIHLLFRHKRAEQLAKSLSALITLRQVITRSGFNTDWEKIGNEEAVAMAIRTALTAQKSKHVGTSMLELNVCGAIPPYNEILGGKLVALLATSPQVIHDYKERYEGRSSEIASKIKGSEVCRPADLVYIGTTSLYSIGSSQYNRLHIPKSEIDSKMDIRWEKLGKTTGYGTLHISRATSSCLKDFMGENSKVNHVFGEGPSPKLRLLTEAIRNLLEPVSEDTKDFTKHSMTRLVYGVKLACNTTAYMLGFDEKPDFYTADIDDYETGTQKIIRFWQERWLASRIKFEPIFERLNSFNKESILVGNEIKSEEEWHFEKLKEPADNQITTNETGHLQFIRDFYRGKSAFADGISFERLKSIHIKTKLDDAICQAVSNGQDVVLTGNPGDGKTHIIRMLNKELIKRNPKIEIELDASTKTNEELFNCWKKANDEGKVFVVAINAAVLYSLYIAHNDFKPIADAYYQMIHAVSHGEEIEETNGVIVFDLSHREVLTEDIIDAVIKKLTADTHYTECTTCPLGNSCPVATNRKIINTTYFKERILSIAKRAILRGYHATLRDLQAFVSYLIFGDRECATIAETTGNNKYDVCNLVYSGKGNLFDAFRSAFDPVQMSHPVWDEKILTNDIEATSWQEGFNVPLERIDINNPEEFRLKKRQFFFFNQNGDDLIRILDDDISLYQDFLAKNDKAIIKDVIKKLNAFFGKGDTSTELEIWSGHRFNNSPKRVLISSGSIKTNKFLVGHPKLLESMSTGIDMYQNYIRIYPKNNREVFLKVDFTMYSFLTAAERGVPVLYMDSHMTKRVWRFIEQLQALIENDQDDSDVKISLLDIQNKVEHIIHIDLDDHKYVSIEKEQK